MTKQGSEKKRKITKSCTVNIKNQRGTKLNSSTELYDLLYAMSKYTVINLIYYL